MSMLSEASIVVMHYRWVLPLPSHRVGCFYWWLQLNSFLLAKCRSMPGTFREGIWNKLWWMKFDRWLFMSSCTNVLFKRSRSCEGIVPCDCSSGINQKGSAAERQNIKNIRKNSIILRHPWLISITRKLPVSITFHSIVSANLIRMVEKLKRTSKNILMKDVRLHHPIMASLN